jgi:hypothetical protein
MNPVVLQCLASKMPILPDPKPVGQHNPVREMEITVMEGLVTVK